MTALAETMRAVAILPGRAGSNHLREVRRPTVNDVPDGRGVLVEVLRVGVDGTDRELVEAQYGVAPAGDDYLVIGHESLGRVVEAGRSVPPHLAPGTLVVATVRRPGGSLYDLIGLQDFTTEEPYERGITRLHGFMAEGYVEEARWLVPLPAALEPVGVLLEPLSCAEKAIRQAYEIQRRARVWRPERAAVLGAGTLGLLLAMVLRLRGVDVTVYSRRAAPYRNSEAAEALGARYVSSSDTSVGDLGGRHGPFDLVIDATGASGLAFQAATVLAMNGVLVLLGVNGGQGDIPLPADRINRDFVLGNRVMVGSVNANRDDFVTGVADLTQAEAFYPGWLAGLLTTPIAGLERHEEMVRALREDRDAIKVYVEVAASSA